MSAGTMPFGGRRDQYPVWMPMRIALLMSDLLLVESGGWIPGTLRPGHLGLTP
jgi:hypothetical protein